MCTVTTIPLNGNKIVLTSNRDESKARPTLSPTATAIGNSQVYFPKDLEAGGTWIAAGNQGRICCLLNGAFVKHKRHLPYAKSRGQVLLDAFNYANILDFFEEVKLNKIEPFTLVVIDQKDLYEFRWDAKEKHLKKLNINEPHIWASATLYSDETRAQRTKWFSRFLEKNNNISPQTIYDFHSSKHGTDPENDVVMTRTKKGLQTVSITQIVAEKDVITMSYHDLQNETKPTQNTLNIKQYA